MIKGGNIFPVNQKRQKNKEIEFYIRFTKKKHKVTKCHTLFP